MEPSNGRKRLCAPDVRRLDAQRYNQLLSLSSMDDVIMLDIDNITSKLQDTRIISSLELLPNEILLKIFGNLVPSPPHRLRVQNPELMMGYIHEMIIGRVTLRNLCLTSKHIAAVANPMLHRFLLIWDWPTILLALRQMMQHPDLQRSVRTIICNVDLRDYWAMYSGKKEGARWLPTIFGDGPIALPFETQMKTTWIHHILTRACRTRKHNLFMALALHALVMSLPRVEHLRLRLPRPTAAGTFEDLEPLWRELVDPRYIVTVTEDGKPKRWRDDESHSSSGSDSELVSDSDSDTDSGSDTSSRLPPLPDPETEGLTEPRSVLGKRNHPHDTPYQSTISNTFCPPRPVYPLSRLQVLELVFDPESFNIVANPPPVPDFIVLHLAVSKKRERHPEPVFRSVRKLEARFSATAALHRILVELRANRVLESIDLSTAMISGYKWRQTGIMLARGHDWNINKVLAACRSTLTSVHLDLLTCVHGGAHLYGPMHRLTCLAHLAHVTTLSVTLQGAFGGLEALEDQIRHYGDGSLVAHFPAELVSLTLIEWWDAWVSRACYCCHMQEAPRHQYAVVRLLVLLPDAISSRLPRLRHLCFVANPHFHTRPEWRSSRKEQWFDSMSEDEYRLSFASIAGRGVDFCVRMRMISDGEEPGA